jgi:hypothetical protein
MIPAWLLAKAGGNLRAAGIRLCRCGAPTLVGLDADRAAITAICDLTPIDEIGETLALLQGRATYDLVGGSQKREIEYRYEWNIKIRRRYPVLAAHKCGIPLPVRTEPQEALKGNRDDDECPF